MTVIRTSDSGNSLYSSPNPNQLLLLNPVIAEPPTDPTKADLSLRMWTSNLTPKINDVISYTLAVVNGGGANAANVQLANLLPAGLIFVDGTGWSANGNTLSGTVGSVDVGRTVSVSFRARVTGSGRLTSQAQIAASNIADPDSTPGNGYTNGEDDTAQISIRTQ